ncbi:hypothetical protein BDA96_10G205600 [Sorghum bicolor]|uniref:Uncharacterized protein n=2 Tax=Sorghum bicolor TaxID=4558 RepID=A0A921Q333_SORBI|nr:hypothetical protein BDA96_10G205600 [Sorghum bicolor]KXG20117.1 hypothetical protein SORBI_3010G157200 [Sorghum bicolor]
MLPRAELLPPLTESPQPPFSTWRALPRSIQSTSNLPRRPPTPTTRSRATPSPRGLGWGKFIASKPFNVGGFDSAIYFYNDRKSHQDGGMALPTSRSP